MSDTAILVENLGKQYRIGTREPYQTLSGTLTNALKAPIRRVQSIMSREQIADERSSIWSLKDVSFEVKQGEVVGVIGRNGAGKSTLLKILSRITEPTEGHVRIHGRVASLLEVGTGFHPELTGRENIYLNGAILGMKRAEIVRKFDEIVAFAEVEKFIDTPVKHFSSGMYLRLAFAVAAHLEPEILLVDEVLAVGDAEFQKKCLGKMGEVAKEGRTVLFVSHNMAAISHLCSTCLLMKGGELALQGATHVLIDQYLSSVSQQGESQSRDVNAYRPSWASPVITLTRLMDTKGQERASFPMGSDIVVEMTFRTLDNTSLKAPVMGVVINHAIKGTVGGINSIMTGSHTGNGPYAYGVMRCTLKRPPILQGQYTLDIWLGDGSINIDMLSDCYRFSIEETDIYGSGIVPFAHMGTVFIDAKWEIDSGERN